MATTATVLPAAGILIFAPTTNWLCACMPFSRIISPTVVLYLAASTESVSPCSSVCVVYFTVCASAPAFINAKKNNSNNLENIGLEIGQQLAVNSKGIAAAAAANKEATEKKAAEVKQPVTVVGADKTNDKIISLDSLAKADAAVKKQEPKVVIVPSNTKSAAAETPVAPGIMKDGSDSFFALDFFAENSKKLKRISGDAMTFKTASGWLDKKYYVLMNGIPAGTLVKITAENGNSIYAKVLWKLDDMKLNQGLAFRVNEAAAAALNIAFNKFPLNIDYHE